MSEGIMNYGKLEGKWTYWYENGQIQTVGKYIKDKEDSIWTLYSQDNTILQEGNFNKGLKEGKWTYYYDDGKISHSGLYENDRINGKWIYYNQNGQIIQEVNYLRDHLNGEWTSWHENGNLYEKGFYTQDLKDGEWISHHPNGSVNEELSYKNDTVNIHNVWDESGQQIVTDGYGEFISYFENENIDTKGKIIKGKPQGLWTSYYEDGKKREELFFENNTSKLMSFWTQEGTLSVKDGNGKYYLFYENGRLQIEGNFKNGLKEGEWRSFYENADDLEKNIYKDGKLNGLSEAWYENGVAQVTGIFINDKREGEWIWYSENGNVTSIVNFINGKKEGTQKFWNNFNTLLKEEIYKNGELIKVRIK
jgi:antitoxin component YwqK of YwqJK toxin-antitoxin module